MELNINQKKIPRELSNWYQTFILTSAVLLMASMNTTLPSNAR